MWRKRRREPGPPRQLGGAHVGIAAPERGHLPRRSVERSLSLYTSSSAVSRRSGESAPRTTACSNRASPARRVSEMSVVPSVSQEWRSTSYRLSVGRSVSPQQRNVVSEPVGTRKPSRTAVGPSLANKAVSRAFASSPSWLAMSARSCWAGGGAPGRAPAARPPDRTGPGTPLPRRRWPRSRRPARRLPSQPVHHSCRD